MEECDKVNFDRRNSCNNALTLGVMWFLQYCRYGFADPFSGLPMDFSVPAMGTLSPTLLAHSVHARPFHYGPLVPYPASINDLDREQVNGRVELRLTNFSIRSYDISTLTSMLASAGPLAQRVENQLVATDVLDTAILSARLTLRPSVFQEYELNGLSPLALERLFHLPVKNPTLQACHSRTSIRALQPGRLVEKCL